MNCLACGSTDAKPSREHVFASWLLEEFGRDSTIGLYRPSPDGSYTQIRQEIRLNSFTLKHVCDPCNKGWMSTLESRTKPIILDLARNGHSPKALPEEERCTLAKWVAKTAIILSHSIGAECPIRSEFLSEIRVNPDDRPGNFAVLVMRTDFDSFAHASVGVIRDLIGGGRVAGNVTVLLMPHLAFVCAFPMVSNLPWKCSGPLSLVAPLWPREASWSQLNIQASNQIPGDMGNVLFTMAGWIEIFQRVA